MSDIYVQVCTQPIKENLFLICFCHTISIPAYVIEQQWWQSGVPKNEMLLMSLIFKNNALAP
jgi:hypothetical protein